MESEKLALDIEYLPEMPRDKSVGIGCVGSGFIMSDCHLVAYRQAGFNPVAITSKDPEQLRSVAERHGIPNVYDELGALLENKDVKVVDIAVPPDAIADVVREVVKHGHIEGVLSQKPMGCNYEQAKEIVGLCEAAGITLGVNQNMRFDQSVRACKNIIDKGYLGECVLGTIDMRAIPHWMEWQKRLGFVTLRTMSIHHLDCFRYLFGNPKSVYASVRKDPRTMKNFDHEDGICLYILEWENGLRASSWDDVWTGPAREGSGSDIGISWRIEGTEGLAKGTIGWPYYPARVASTIDFTTTKQQGYWFSPRWDEVWFPDAFAGPMATLLRALESDGEPLEIAGKDNLGTMALVDACYLSVKEHRPVDIAEIWKN